MTTTTSKKAGPKAKADPKRKAAAKKPATLDAVPPSKRKAIAKPKSEAKSKAARESKAIAKPKATRASNPDASSVSALAQPAKAAPRARAKKKTAAVDAPPAEALSVDPAALVATVSATPVFPDTEYSVVARLLVGFVADEVRKVGVARAVLGLSGGVDSAVSAAIAARALGPSNVLGVFMPYRSSVPESQADANEVAASLGIETVVVDITPQVDAYFERFADASRLRRGNKMARERMTILYDHSASRSALVVGTSNKTELLLGYGTLYGDMASALNPIGDLYKTQVWGLARHLGLPASVIEKAPTADLWSGQTDETELGFSYHEVDRLLYHMIDERCSTAELVEMGFDAAFVERISRMVRSSQFKRRLPIIAKLSARSIDTDFRYSRDWGL